MPPVARLMDGQWRVADRQMMHDGMDVAAIDCLAAHRAKLEMREFVFRRTAAVPLVAVVAARRLWNIRVDHRTRPSR